jgi:hypothetical protein
MPAVSSDPEPLWTVPEMARFHKVSTATIYKHASEFGAIRAGRQLRFPAPQALTLNTSQRGHHPTTGRVR